MDIPNSKDRLRSQNSMDGLRLLLGVNPSTTSAPQSKANPSAAISTFDSDPATGSEVSLVAYSEGVRADKVAAVQAALAAGTYSVPATAVASRTIDSMLTDGWAEGEQQRTR
jgi:negative regulator of flagellin synthesis FlgM